MFPLFRISLENSSDRFGESNQIVQKYFFENFIWNFFLGNFLKIFFPTLNHSTGFFPKQFLGLKYHRQELFPRRKEM